MNTKTRTITKNSVKKYAFGIAVHILSFICGFVLSKTVMFSRLLPLGISFSAAVPLPFTLSAAFGSFLGYFVPAVTGKGFKYITLLFGTVSLKIITVNFKSKFNSPLCFSVITAVVTLFVGVVSLESYNTFSALFLFSEVVLSASFCYFLSKALSKDYINSKGINSSELTAFVVAANVILLGFFNVKIEEISLGKILAILLVLFAAYFRKTAGGAICGISLSLTLWLSGATSEIALMVTVGGLICGFFSPLSKLASALSLMFCSIIITIISNLSPVSIAFMVETFVGGILFLIMPQKVTAVLGSVFAENVNIQSLDSIKSALVTKLSLSAAALNSINEMVETVAQKLEKYNNTNYSDVLKNIENEACKGCLLRLNCWENNRESTLEAVLSFGNALRQGSSPSLVNLPLEFADRCIRLERFENSVTVNYLNYQNSVKAENRISEMREIVSQQMNGMASVLNGLATEFKQKIYYNSAIASNVAAALKSIDLRASDCGCIIDEHNRITLEIKLSYVPKTPVNRKRIMQLLELTCDRKFEPPVVKKVKNEVFITVSERTDFAVDYAVSQINCNNNLLSGDAVDCFLDGKGKFYVMLSDGMGTGSRAAVDSAMVIGLFSKLIKAGFPYSTALKIVNFSLMYKSTDESSATVDISCVDLFNGTTELLKAGAAPTFVRRNGRAGKAACNSLPVGILKDVGFDRAVVKLKEKDIILMFSDGVTVNGTDWITAQLETFGDGSAKQLADKICNLAKQNRSDGHQDDITVVAVILEKRY